MKEAGIKTRYRVLDYGCGPGGYILPLSEMVGKEGFVYALGYPGNVLKEIHRILKPVGIVSFSDHHMKKEEIIKTITDNGLFRYHHQGNKTFTFIKVSEPNSF